MSHTDELLDYNKPYIEHTMDLDNNVKSLTDSMTAIIAQVAAKTPKKKSSAVTIDDEAVK